MPGKIYSGIDALMSIPMAIAGGYFSMFLLSGLVMLLLVGILGIFTVSGYVF